MFASLIEPLERRRLLAGVTLLTHGQSGNVNGWIKRTADGIVSRLGGSANASVYTMKVRDAGGGKLAVTEFSLDSGYSDYRDTTTAEIIIKHDWSKVSGGAFPTGAVAKATADYLLAPRTSKALPPIAELPMHVVGHSRGASLAVELSRYLGRRGVVVDQVSYLDPHPVDGVDDIGGLDFGDAPMRVYDNVVFADNYWRTDGNTQNFDPDGEPVSGTHQGDLNNSVQRDFILSAHNAVTAYYVGTVNTSTRNGGDHPVRSSWYQPPNPARTETGYFFSRLGGGSRPTGGLGAIGGGSAARQSPGQDGSQFPSLVQIRPKGGFSSFAAGQAVQATLRAGQRGGGSASVTLFLDSDRNPYNSLGRQVNASTISGGVRDRDFSILDTATLAPGNYALGAKVQAPNGQTSYVYGRTLAVTPAVPVGSISNRILTVTATPQADVVTLAAAGSQIVATVNGNSSPFNLAEFDRIEVYLEAGDDRFASDDAIMVGTYVLGGDGADHLTGGGGQDTLSGGAQKNTLLGAAGEDRLNGSGAPDDLVGGPGEDRLYGNGGDDRLEGVQGVDRLFGGDGNDSLVGGTSNDKLYGEAGDDTLFGNAGADIADGGTGIDASENDPLDLRTSIEVLL